MYLASEKYNNVFNNVENEYYYNPDFCESSYIGNIIDELKLLLKDDFEQYEFVIYSQTPQNSKPAYPFGKSTKKEVVIYLSDEASRIPHELMRTGAFAVFKNYLLSDVPYPNLFHLPLGYVNSTPALPVAPVHTRKTNVFFSGALHFARLSLYQHFTPYNFLPNRIWQRFHRFIYSKTEFDTYYPDSFIRFNKQGFKSGLNPRDFAAMLYNSKIVICPRGVISYETFRHFEAMRAGCIIISEKLPETFFYSNSPMLILSEWSKLDNVIKHLLANPEEQERLQAATLDWWNNVCSEQAIAQYIYDKLKALS
ncbi:hypothetical protein [Rufibacter tibetensis]|uniref:Exostosin GT47 domain-containing protein n=1 Tax=Rufibacter tibetensis TaxID=512763 RepID=A0A0P0C3S2_9BACT|nr:hypothetical protein [Rufibacter tibetensis]ALI99761.1 hypothetical protein DC20_13235 [Rufibacter tibetensis]